MRPAGFRAVGDFHRARGERRVCRNRRRATYQQPVLQKSCTPSHASGAVGSCVGGVVPTALSSEAECSALVPGADHCIQASNPTRTAPRRAWLNYTLVVRVIGDGQGSYSVNGRGRHLRRRRRRGAASGVPVNPGALGNLEWLDWDEITARLGSCAPKAPPHAPRRRHAGEREGQGRGRAGAGPGQGLAKTNSRCQSAASTLGENSLLYKDGIKSRKFCPSPQRNLGSSFLPPQAGCQLSLA